MYKQSKQFLNSINFVQDITPETAANCSGGASVRPIPGDDGSGSDIVLYEDVGLGGNLRSYRNINVGDGDPLLRTSAFNDTTTSILIREGTYEFYEGDDYTGDKRVFGTAFLPPNTVALVNLTSFSDKMSSFRRIA